MVRLNSVQAARYCGFKIATLKAYVYMRQLPAHAEVGRKGQYFVREELNEWLLRHKAGQV